LSAVSLGVPSSRSPGANATIGGLAPRTLKKLNGAALIFPSGLRLVTQCDRARGHEAHQQRISAMRIFFFKVEFHGADVKTYTGTDNQFYGLEPA